MADLAFPSLWDVDRAVRQKVNQPRNRPGQPTWDDEEFEQAYNKAYAWTCRELSNMDQQYQSQVADVTGVAGAVSLTLPTRTSFVRSVWVLDANGEHPIRRVYRGRGDQIRDGQWRDQEIAVYSPDGNILTFSRPLPRTTLFRVYHGVYFVPLIHAPVLVGGGATAQLPEWEPSQSGIFTNLTISVPEGTGVGQNRTVSGYNGATKTITVSVAWTTVPDDTSWITSEPDLPWLARDLFENYSVACLFEKTNEQAAEKFRGLAVAARQPFMDAVMRQERREPDIQHDRELNGGWADPATIYTNIW